MTIPKLSRKLEVILVGVIFAVIPALFFGGFLLLVSGSWTLAGIGFAGVFGFGLDINFGKGCR